MERYIDAEALKQDLIKRGFYPAIVKRAIEDAPPADAVEVVRCKDCIHRGKPTCGMSYFDGKEKFPAHIKNNDFCSYGECKPQKPEVKWSKQGECPIPITPEQFDAIYADDTNEKGGVQE